MATLKVSGQVYYCITTIQRLDKIIDYYEYLDESYNLKLDLLDSGYGWYAQRRLNLSSKVIPILVDVQCY